MDQLGYQELACGWAVHTPLLAGFQGPDFAGHGFCLSPRLCQLLRGSDLGLGYELGLSVYSPVMPFPQSSLNPMCTYPDVLLYICSFPCFRVARIDAFPWGAWPRDAAVTRTGKQAGKALRSQGYHYARVMRQSVSGSLPL